jgi:hypothetical protein
VKNYLEQLRKNVTDTTAHHFASLLRERLEKFLASDAARQCQISRDLWLSDMDRDIVSSTTSTHYTSTHY